MNNIKIVSDGSCDLPSELVKERDVTVVPFYVSFDSENYMKEGVDVGIRDFYQTMIDDPKTFPKSSLPSIEDYYNTFLKLVSEGYSVICICITTKFSGSLQSANTAKDMILETIEDAKITVIDSTINTILQGLYVLESCKIRDKDWSYDQIIERLIEIRMTGRILFTIGSIDYL